MLFKFINFRLNQRVIWLTLLVGNIATAQNVLDTKGVSEISLSNAEVSSFVSSERESLDGLVNGTIRLERLCAAPLKPPTEKMATQALNELRSQLLDAGQRTSANAQRSVSLTEFAVIAAQQDGQKACSPLNRIKALLVAAPDAGMTCEGAKQVQASALALNKAAKEWLRIHEERQRRFVQLIKLESAGCTRAGFAQRMIEAHEKALAPFEDQALGLFESALKRISPTSVSKP